MTTTNPTRSQTLLLCGLLFGVGPACSLQTQYLGFEQNAQDSATQEPGQDSGALAPDAPDDAPSPGVDPSAPSQDDDPSQDDSENNKPEFRYCRPRAREFLERCLERCESGGEPCKKECRRRARDWFHRCLRDRRKQQGEDARESPTAGVTAASAPEL